jgi:hypothetical protein
MIDSKQAAAALSDIDTIVRRVRQSRTYEIASLIMIWWGALVLAGNLVTYGWPRYGGLIWTTVNAMGAIGSLVISAFAVAPKGGRSLDLRIAVAFLLFFAFGLLCSTVFGHFGPRELGAFWPIYFMLIYCIAGLWFGYAFVAIGLAITVLTLIGYFFVGSAAFLLWMAVVNGCGLILSGLWMRWS